MKCLYEKRVLLRKRTHLSQELFFVTEGGNIKMTKAGDHVRCPQCGGDARVVWISQDGETVAIKCARYHSQISPPPTRFTSHAQSKTKKGMVFLIETTQKK